MVKQMTRMAKQESLSLLLKEIDERDDEWLSLSDDESN